MTGKNATPLIGWHSADPTAKPWVKAEAARRGITERELLDEALAEYRERRDPTQASPPPSGRKEDIMTAEAARATSNVRKL